MATRRPGRWSPALPVSADPTARQPDIALPAGLGREPRIPPDEGLRSTIAWMRDARETGPAGKGRS